MGNMHLVTGYQGQDHVTAADHGSLYAAIFGNGSYVLDRGNKLAASVISSNKVRISDGDIVLQGRHIRLNEGASIELTIENGTQGYKRNDLIVARYTRNASTGIEEANLVVIKGAASTSTPADPAYNNGDILTDHAEVVDFPLYRVPLDGITVGTLEQLFDVAYLVTLGSDKKIPSDYLPSMDYIPSSQKGKASGVASLGSDGKVPSSQLPSMNYIPTSQKGAANGVAPLNSSGIIPPTHIVQTGEITISNPPAYIAFTKEYARYMKIGRLVYFRLEFGMSTTSGGGTAIKLNGLPLPEVIRSTGETAPCQVMTYGTGGVNAYSSDVRGDMTLSGSGITVSFTFDQNTTHLCVCGTYIAAS